MLRIALTDTAPWDAVASYDQATKDAENRRADFNCVFAPSHRLLGKLEPGEEIQDICATVAVFLRWFFRTRLFFRLRVNRFYRLVKVIRKFCVFVKQRRQTLLNNMLEFWKVEERKEYDYIRKMSVENGGIRAMSFRGQLRSHMRTFVPDDMKLIVLRNLYFKKLAHFARLMAPYLQTINDIQKEQKTLRSSLLLMQHQKKAMLGSDGEAESPVHNFLQKRRNTDHWNPVAVKSRLLELQQNLQDTTRTPPKLGFDTESISLAELKRYCGQYLAESESLCRVPSLVEDGSTDSLSQENSPLHSAMSWSGAVSPGNFSPPLVSARRKSSSADLVLGMTPRSSLHGLETSRRHALLNTARRDSKQMSRAHSGLALISARKGSQTSLLVSARAHSVSNLISARVSPSPVQPTHPGRHTPENVLPDSGSVSPPPLPGSDSLPSAQEKGGILEEYILGGGPVQKGGGAAGHRSRAPPPPPQLTTSPGRAVSASNPKRPGLERSASLSGSPRNASGVLSRRLSSLHRRPGDLSPSHSGNLDPVLGPSFPHGSLASSLLTSSSSDDKATAAVVTGSRGNLCRPSSASPTHHNRSSTQQQSPLHPHPALAGIPMVAEGSSEEDDDDDAEMKGRNSRPPRKTSTVVVGSGGDSNNSSPTRVPSLRLNIKK